MNFEQYKFSFPNVSKMTHHGNTVLFNPDIVDWVKVSNEELHFYEDLKENRVEKDRFAKYQDLIVKLLLSGIIHTPGMDRHFNLPQTPFQISDLKAVYIGMTKACNLKCIYCYDRSGKKNPQEFKPHELQQLLKELHETTEVKEIIFTGGEPLLNKNIFDYAKIIKSYGLKLSMISNGRLIREHNIDAISQLFDNVTISLDSFTEAFHNTHRGDVHAFENALRAINLLYSKNVTLFINTTVSKINLPDVVATADKIVRDYPKARQRTAILSKMGRGDACSDLCLNQHEILKMDDDLYTHFTNKDLPPETIKSFAKEFFIKKHTIRTTCSMARSEMYVTPTLDVFPCRITQFPEYKLGNLRENSFKEIVMNSKVAQEVRGWSVESEPKCRECSIKYVCAGGCRSHHYTQTGSLFKTDPELCEVLYPKTVRKIVATSNHKEI